MSSTVIKIDNLSKQYRLGEVGTGTISHDLNRWWAKIRGKEDPFLTVGSLNDRSTAADSDYVWALKDIAFDVKQGEVLGIIGRNGAGKSTLLKILSKTTTPTTGSIRIKGRIASLLEVGTGFHPEMTGRENIYLNGAILGMTKKEIRKKFDEIVDFAGVEKYVDTPVKRYSSGMYVRLAFGVAAHLEPEILIVDEVLAVGDAEFQKKCLGKMKSVSVEEGRTVLFVSHNMGAVQGLCNRGLLLKNGQIDYLGAVSDTILYYSTENNGYINGDSLLQISKRNGNGSVQFASFHLEDAAGNILSNAFTGASVVLVFTIMVHDFTVKKIDLGFSLHNMYDDMQSYLYSGFQEKYFSPTPGNKQLTIKCMLKKFPFAHNQLIVRGRIIADGNEADFPQEKIGTIPVEPADFYGNGKAAPSMAPFLIKGEWN